MWAPREDSVRIRNWDFSSSEKPVEDYKCVSLCQKLTIYLELFNQRSFSRVFSACKIIKNDIDHVFSNPTQEPFS
jgi:hypothetical protein